MHEYDKHVNTFIHKILEHLKKYDRPLLYREIEEKTGINILNNPQLVKSLRNNPKISITHESIQFIPSYTIRSTLELEETLRRVNGREGIEMDKLLDSPIDIRPFIEELVSIGRIIILKDMDNSEIVFYNEMTVPPMKEEIKKLWNSIKIPNFYDIASELSQLGLKGTEIQAFKRQKTVKQTNSKKNKRKIALTNTHVKGLDLNNLDED